MGISTKFTYRDLQAIPPDHHRYEIVDGELFVSPSPIFLHQLLVSNLHRRLAQHASKRKLGVVVVAPCDIVFSRYTVLEPDIFFVSKNRFQIIGEKNLSGPPDLVVEVLSPSTSRLDREIKFKQYAQYGVPEFWLVDPGRKTIKIFRLKAREYEVAALLRFGDTLTSPLFPGLAIPVAELWEMM